MEPGEIAPWNREDILKNCLSTILRLAAKHSRYEAGREFIRLCSASSDNIPNILKEVLDSSSGIEREFLAGGFDYTYIEVPSRIQHVIDLACED